MRIRGIQIEDFRSIHSPQVVPLGGLTVLYGANGSGKTNVLTAIERVFGEDKDAWSEGDIPNHRWRDRHLMPTVAFELESADVPGHPDRALLERMLRDEFGGRSYDSLLGDEETHRALTTGAGLDELKELLVDALVAGFDTPEEDRRTAATAMLERYEVVAEPLETWWICDYSELSSAAVDAVARVAHAAPEGDELGELCRRLLEEGVANVEYLGDGILESALTWTDDDGKEHREPWSIADTVRMEYEASDIEQAVVAAISAALRQMRGPLPPQVQQMVQNGKKVTVINVFRDPDPDSLLASEWRGWITKRMIEGEHWARLHPQVHRLAAALGDRATELLPGFAREQGTIQISVAELGDWAMNSPVSVRFVQPDGSQRTLSQCGAGTRRWAAASIHLACAELANSTWTNSGPVEGNEAPVPTPTWPERIGDLLLVDEPEANLHPAAVEDVLDWLVAVAPRTGGVVVATHHPAFLSLGDDDADLVHVQVRAGKTHLRDVTSTDVRSTDALIADLGISRADLLQRTRMLLFVEGPHDRSIVDAYIGDLLTQARVKVVPMHGTDNAMALVDSDLATALDIPIGVLIDNATGVGTAEERAIDRLQSEARAEGVTVARFGIKKRDILHYLDDEVCRSAAPKFPGWDAAVEEWRAGSRAENFKRFVTQTYGLRLDRKTVDRLARESALHGPPPRALLRIAKEVVAAADDAARGRWEPDPDTP